MGRLTDGQESIPWATGLLLATQPCQLHNAHPSPSTAPPLLLTPHFISTVSRYPVYCVTQLLSGSPHSFTLLLELLSLSFFSSTSSGRNGLFAKPLPNPLIFLHVVTARAAIPLSLHPFLLCGGEASAQIPGWQPHAATLASNKLEHHIK